MTTCEMFDLLVALLVQAVSITLYLGYIKTYFIVDDLDVGMTVSELCLIIISGYFVIKTIKEFNSLVEKRNARENH